MLASLRSLPGVLAFLALDYWLTRKIFDYAPWRWLGPLDAAQMDAAFWAIFVVFLAAFAVWMMHYDAETERQVIEEATRARAEEDARLAAERKAKREEAARIRAIDDYHAACRSRVERTAQLEQQVRQAFAEYTLRADFTGAADPAALRQAFARALLAKPLPDMGLLRESTNADIAALLQAAGVWPAAPPRPIPPPGAGLV